jgi:hypothetical protein
MAAAFDSTASSSPAKARVSYGSLISERKNDRAAKSARARLRRSSSLQLYKTFLQEFHDSTVGGWLVVFLGFLSAVGVGCLVGVVPRVATQLYAERIFWSSGTGAGGEPPDGPGPVCGGGGGGGESHHAAACLKHPGSADELDCGELFRHARPSR